MKKFPLFFLIMVFIACSGNCGILSSKSKVLIATPIRQKPAILKEFLESLENLEKTTCQVEYFFIDDNVDLEAKEMLKSFLSAHKKNCEIENAPADNSTYECNESGHFWKEDLIWKVASFKDKMIQKAKKKGSDFLLLVDSDLVLHPKSLEKLISDKKEIVSNIFWTTWQNQQIALPQVWLYDEYTQYEAEPGITLSTEEIQDRYLSFVVKMRSPGLYEVGGLGSCTLISKSALNKEISFKKIKNLTFKGADRHFSVRAASLGIELFVDTHFPAFHIYRESALAGAENFKKICKAEKKSESAGITLCMLVKDASLPYLKRSLEVLKNCVSQVVLLSTSDNLDYVLECANVLEGIPCNLFSNSAYKMQPEKQLRRLLWDETIKKNPNWILFLDAAEVIEDRFEKEVKSFLSNGSIGAYYFRFYDFWDEDHYREDEKWQSHKAFRPALVHYFADIPYVWSKEQESAFNFDRFPASVVNLLGATSNIRIKHFGLASKAVREEAYKNFEAFAPEDKEKVKEVYQSLVAESPTLIKWDEKDF